MIKLDTVKAVGDEHATHVELEAAVRVRAELKHVLRRSRGDVQNALEFDVTLEKKIVLEEENPIY